MDFLRPRVNMRFTENGRGCDNLLFAKCVLTRTIHLISSLVPSVGKPLHRRITTPLYKTYRRFFGPKRYRYLFDSIRAGRCRKIIEIGVWDGEQSLMMINEARKIHGSNVEYYGFDLFEDLDEELYQKEVTKRPSSLEEVRRRLEKAGCTVRLFPGSTLSTLSGNIDELPEMDLIFIDGGHSIETIQNGWDHARRLMSQSTFVLFDDYWSRDDAGCRKVVERTEPSEYDVEVLPIQDRF